MKTFLKKVLYFLILPFTVFVLLVIGYIINPLYSQEKFNPKDMEMIQNVFGRDNVYDFSGRNQFTTSKYNYYEESHFRPLVGDSIMSIVYRK